MNSDHYDAPTLSDFALFAVIMAWRMSPLLIVPAVVVGLAVMIGRVG